MFNLKNQRAPIKLLKKRKHTEYSMIDTNKVVPVDTDMFGEDTNNFDDTFEMGQDYNPDRSVDSGEFSDIVRSIREQIERLDKGRLNAADPSVSHWSPYPSQVNSAILLTGMIVMGNCNIQMHYYDNIILVQILTCMHV